MAGFISTVRFLVKDGCVDEFIKAHNEQGDGAKIKKLIGLSEEITTFSIKF